MKAIILSAFLVIFYISGFSQTTNYGVTQDGCINRLVISVTSVDFDFIDPPLNFWASGVVTLTWDKTYGQNIIGTLTNLTTMAWAKNTSTGYIDLGTKWGYEFTLSPEIYAVDIANGETVDIFTLGLIGSGFATFNLENPAANASLYNTAVTETFGGYNPATVSNVNQEPAVFWDGTDWCGGTGTSNQPGASDATKNCYINGANGVITASGAFVNQLVIAAGANLTIDPGASLTANGATTITDANSLRIAASASGVGSFIDNGTINYGASGTAAVETYLSNSGTYYYHQVGPTVDNLGSGSGVTLGDFDISTLNTFAYEWNEPSQAWENPFSTTYPVNTGKGLMLTTDDGTSGEYDQIGALINSNVTLNLNMSGDPMTSSYGWNLKSNPYTAALDWDDVWTREDPIFSNDLNPTVYVLNNGNANYASYNASTNVGTGMTKDIQVGQGFWVQYLQNPYVAPGSLNITLQPGDRNHSTTAFLKNSIIDQLTLTSTGNNSTDILAIAFREFGTYNYDLFADVDKWESYWEDATEIWTVSNDNKFLTHNILPTLGNAQVSVPMSFECHAEGEYTITASDIESFQGNVEIYLEDLLTGGEWHNLVLDNSYSFSGAPDDNQARFVVHFFGTTGLDDLDPTQLISIYSWGQDAYIVNRGKETVKEYVAYDMMGRELHRGTLPNNDVNKVQIGSTSAYYIVKVFTKEGGIYTGKVYITK